MKKQKIILAISLTLLTPRISAENRQNKDFIVRTPLLTAKIEPEKKLDTVDIKRIDFSPLQKVGLHSHPVPVVGYIAKGKILFQIDGESAKTLKVGDAFFEPADTTILHFDNPSKTESASFVAFYLMEKNDHEIIKMLN